MIKRFLKILTVFCLMIGVLLNGTAARAEETTGLSGKWFLADDRDIASIKLATGEITAASGEYNAETDQWVFSDAIPTGEDEATDVAIRKPDGNDSEPSGFKVGEGEGTEENPYTFELVYPEATAYTVTITGGANATATGGEVTQNDLTGEMTAVTFTANEGFHFEAYEGETVDGITTELNEGVITVSGTPDKDVNITIPDAVQDVQEKDNETSADVEVDKNTANIDNAEQVSNVLLNAANDTEEKGTPENPWNVGPGDIATESVQAWLTGEGNSKTLHIKGSGAMNSFSVNARPPFEDHKDEITKVEIENGVTSVGEYAFYGYHNLQQVAASGLFAINAYAFANCESLNSVNLSSINQIGKYAFNNCSNITSITIPSNITIINIGAFEGCSSLSEVKLDKPSYDHDLRVFEQAFSNTATNAELSFVGEGSAVLFDGETEVAEGTLLSSLNNKTFNWRAPNVEKYPLWVNGEQVTSGNASDVLDDNTVQYDNETHTLTLNGAKITASFIQGQQSLGGIFSTMGDELTINVVSDSSVMVEEANYGIYIEQSLKIQGDGSLNVRAKRGICSNKNMTIQEALVKAETPTGESNGPAISADNLTIEKATVTATNGNHGISANTVKISNSNVTAKGKKYGIVAANTITINGDNTVITAEGTGTDSCAIASVRGFTIGESLEVVSPEGGKIGSDSSSSFAGFTAVIDAEGMVAKKAVIKAPTPVTQYDLWVGGVQVTSEKEEDVLEDGGTVSFDPKTNTLTLKGANITTGYKYNDGHSEDKAGIYYAGSENLMIVLADKNNIAGSSITDGIFSNETEAKVTFTGNGTLTISTEGYNSQGIFASGEIVINGSTVNVTVNGENSDGIYTDNNITINNATVNASASGKNSDGIDADKVTFSNATVTGTASGEDSDGINAYLDDVVIDGGSVIAYGGSSAIEGKVTNSIPGTGWTNVEGTEGKTRIAVSDTGQDLANYRKVQFPGVLSDWAKLQQQIKEVDRDATITLEKDVTAEEDDVALVIPEGKNITLNLNGNTLSRGLTEAKKDGNVITVNGNLTVEDSSSEKTGKITGGYNLGDGGGIIMDGVSLILNGGSITGNTAGDRGGGVYMEKDASTFTMTGGSISSNTSDYCGGGVYIIDDKSAFTMETGAIISKNQAAYGGGVFVDVGEFIMNGGSITENNALFEKAKPYTKPGCSGGGVFVSYDGVFVMKGGSITNNSATDATGRHYAYGGGVFNEGEFTMEACTTSESMKGGVISGNTAGYGGGVYCEDDFIMETGTISDNEAEREGGGVYSEADVTLTNAEISGNHADWYGGGVSIKGSGSLVMTNSRITGNTADGNGGGVIIGGESSFTMNSGSISDNISDERGGGVASYGDSQFIMTGGVISGNKASVGGGGVYTESSFTMEDGEISGNTANDLGGGVDCDGDFTMSGGRITGNRIINPDKLEEYAGGGGVYIESGNTFKLSGNSVITDNMDDKGDSNMFLDQNSKVTVANALSEQASIGISMQTPGVFTTGSTEQVKASDYKDKFTSDNTDYSVKVEGNELKLAEPEPYPLWVGGVQVTSANKNDVLGPADEGATVTFTPAEGENSAVLTLSGVTITEGCQITGSVGTKGIYYGGTDNLTIELASGSENSIGAGGTVHQGIMAPDATISFTGTGKLVTNGKSDNTSSGDGIFADGINISGAEIIATGDSVGIWIESDSGSVTVTSGTLTATGGDVGIRGTLNVGKNASVTAAGEIYGCYDAINEITGTGWTYTAGTEGKTLIDASAEKQVLWGYKKVQFPALEQASVTEAPEANTLSYNGQAQALVTAGAADGGTMQYAIGADETTAPTEGWNDSIPEGTNAGTYYVWYKAAGDETHNDSVPDCVTVTIGKAALTSVMLSEDTLKYTGSAQTVSIAAVQAGSLFVPAEAYTVEGNTGTKKGTYTVTVTAKTDSNFKGTASAEFEIVEESANVFNVTLSQAKFTYSGSAIVPVITVTNTSTGAALTENTDYVLEFRDNTNAGVGKVLVKGRNNYRGTQVRVFTIARKPVIVSGIGAENKTYDGKTAASLVTENASIEGLVEGDTLIITASGTFMDANVGEKTVTISDLALDGESKDNYELAAEGQQSAATATITAKEVGLIWSDTELTYTGKAQKPIATATGLVGEDTCTVNVTGEQTNAGDYTATAESLGNSNYKLPENNTASFKINKADSTVTAPTSTEPTYNGSAQELVNEASSDDGTVKYAVTTEKKAPADSAFSETIPTEKDAGTYYVWYKVVGDANHNDSKPASVTVTLEKAEMSPTPTVSQEGWTYGESAKTPAVSGNTGGGTVTYSYKAKGAADSTYSDKVPTDAGDYTVKATIAETANYKSSTATADFTIAKASAPAVTEAEKPTAKTGLAYNGSAQELVNAPKSVPEGYTVKYSLDGKTWSSEIPTGTLPGDYTVKVKYEGDSNHESFDGEDLTVSVANGYAVYSGNNQTWVRGSSSNVEITFKASANDSETYSKWDKAVVIDGSAIPASSYTARSGSLVVDLKPAYLDTLALGRHEMKVKFSDGEATAVFNIVGKTPDKKSSDGGSSDKKSTTPIDNVVTCQMAGYPANYAWNESAKACQAGYIDANGTFHPYQSRVIPNTYDGGLMRFVWMNAISLILALACGTILMRNR